MVAPHPRGQRKGLVAAEVAEAAAAVEVEETEVEGCWSEEGTALSLSLSFSNPLFFSLSLSPFLPLQQTALKNCRRHVRAFGNKR